jgi:predicted nucleic acid-binding protein
VRVLLDTSILVAALVRSHPRHGVALPWLARAKAGALELIVAAHTLAELQAILTTLPLRPRISPETAVRLRDENLPLSTEIVALDADSYREVVNRMAALGLAGGIVYDALIARAAEIAGVERLVTLNEVRFRRAWPQGEQRITGP